MQFREVVNSISPFSYRRRYGSGHVALLAGVSIVTIMATSTPIQARSLLRTTGGAISASALAAAAAQSASQQSSAIALQAQSALARAARGVLDFQAKQAAARAAAQLEVSVVPNGLTVGGLDPGVTFSGNTPSNPSMWTGADRPTASVAGGRSQVQIVQTAPKAILTWNTFNVGRETDLYFNQTAGGSNASQWIALNRVIDPGLAPSRILGSIRADGQVYVINKNGIVFGGSSQVSVNTFVASSLGLSNEQFMAGINSQLFLYRDSGDNLSVTLPQFGEHITRNTDPFSPLTAASQPPAYVPDRVPGSVTVQAGASINVASGGKALLFAPNVANHGLISAPDGQVILAAGEQVWLATSTGASMTPMVVVRGLDVAVSAPAPYAVPYTYLEDALNPNFPTVTGFTKSVRELVLPQMAARAASAVISDSTAATGYVVGYRALNDGVVLADRGNITMMARQIDQNGWLGATTALNNRDGTVRLLGWGQGMMAYSSALSPAQLVYWSAGSVTLGQGSVTSVMPDASDTSQIELSTLATRYTAGQIVVRGKLIDVESQASILAPSGKISLVAGSQLSIVAGASSAGEVPLSTDVGIGDGSRIYLAEGAYLSVAGLQNVPLTMESNVVSAELRINELQDSPLYRDSWLRGVTVQVDRRVSGTFSDGPMAGVLWGGAAGAWTGTPLANVSNWLGNGKTTLAELSTVGGAIFIRSNGSVVTRAGSILDISGGSVRYSDGWITTTRMLGADGRIYDIGAATPDKLYVGLASSFSRVHYVQGNIDTRLTETWRSVFDRNNGRRFEQGYTEGRDAGSANGVRVGGVLFSALGGVETGTTTRGIQVFGAEGLALEGSYWGGVINGEKQAADSTSVANGGTLKIGAEGDPAKPFLIGNLNISSNPLVLPANFTATSVLGTDWYSYRPGGTLLPSQAKTTYLDADILGASGMATLKFYVSKGFQLDAGNTLELKPRSTFSVNASAPTGNGATVANFTLGGTIRIAGGTVEFAGPNAMVLNSGAVIDVSGQWINDMMDGASVAAPVINGGSIKLAGFLSGSGAATLDVSGGGWLRLQGSKPKLKVGDSGSIVLYTQTAAQIERLDMRAYAAGSGGTLTVNTTTPSIQIGGTVPVSNAVLYLPGTVFSERGFRSLSVGLPAQTTGTLNVVVPDGAFINQTPLNVDLAGVDLSRMASGSKITNLGPLHALTDTERTARQPAGLSLLGSSVTVGTGAMIQTDIGGSIALAASTADVTVKGTLIAPAGSISLSSSSGAVNLAPTARLLARGVPVIAQDQSGFQSGVVLSGGSISITGGSSTSSTGTITLAAGSLLDVSGASGDIDKPRQRGAAPGRAMIHLASNGGSIVLSDSGNGTSTIDATLIGNAGGVGAAGGTLSITEISPSAGATTSPLLLPVTIPASVWYRDPVSGTAKSIAFSCTTCDLDIRDEYPGVVNLTTAMRTALNQLRSQMQYGVLIVDGQAANAGAATTPIKVSEYNTVITQPVAELLTKYFYTTSALTTKITVPDIQATTAIGVTRIAANSISNGSFSSVSITTPSGVRLGNNVNVTVPGTLTLNLKGALSRLGSATAGANASLRANDIVLGGSSNQAAYSAAAAGKLTLSAQLIEIFGTNSIRGFGETLLDAGEIRIAGYAAASASAAQKITGILDGENKLTIKAGAIYPVSGTSATIKSNGSITVLQNGEASLPYSVAGSLTLAASDIEQDGTLLAPFGTITLDAANSLTLGAGSRTSVSGNGLILPYGNLSNGDSWTLTPLGSTTANVLSALPEKKVTLSAPTVNQKAGAVIDIRGGGDLYASEFVAGPGGSHDVLAMAGIYAVMPSYTSSIAPRDSSTTLVVGDRIWLAGGSGLPAGWYTLLPAQYALLPGAFTVQMMTGSQGKAVTDSVTAIDGSVIMSGYRANAISGATQQIASSWRLMSGSTLRSYSEYNEAFANQFFASDTFKLGQYRLTGVNVVTPRLPMDGGSVVLRATQNLILDGELQSRAAAGGLGGLVDIAGSRIAVVGAGQAVGDLAGYLIVDAASLSRYSAASLLIGGTRAVDPAGTRINVVASNIVLRNDDNSVLSGPEIVLAATGAIAVDAGSAIVAKDDIASRAGDLVIAPVSATTDYGALIRVSNAGAVNVTRQNVVTTAGGLVTIGAGARLSGGKSLLIDATGNTVLANSARVSAEALTMSSGRIGLGGGSSGLILSAQNLAQFANTQTLTLRSYSTIDVYTSLNFGDGGATNVVLDAAGLVGYGNSNVAITGDRLTLKNTGGTLVEPTGVGAGTIALSARELVLGAGSKAIRGFSSVTLSGTQRIVAEGNGTLNAGAAATALLAPVVTGRGGAFQTVNTLGALSISGNGSSDAADDAAQSLGSRLFFTGSRVSVDGRILALGGAVALTATGGDVVLDNGAAIDVGGFAKQFFDVTEYAGAGRVSLTAINGKVDMRSGASIDLSAERDAGSLTVTAIGGGTVALNGRIAAQVVSGKGGSFSLDIEALPDFAGLSQRLNDAGFLASRQLRIRSGNVTVDGTTTVADFGLIADLGSVTINGSIDAKSGYGGRISISAGSGITMNAGGQLNANATSDLGGGRVLLDAAGGVLDLAGGMIDVGGGQGGSVRLRALQTNGAGHSGDAGDHVEVAVNRLNAAITGARTISGVSSVVLEAVSVYNNTSVDAVMTTAAADAATFMGHLPGRLAGKGVSLMAGIEIHSIADLTLASDLDLNSLFGANLRQGGLTLRAAGNLNILGNLSDGFSTALSSGALLSTPSWDLRLIGGADINSAGMFSVAPLAGIAAGSGSVNIGTSAAGKLVRTGTGDLTVVAGRDVNLANYASVTYTAGQKDMSTIANFTAPAAAEYGINGGNLSIVAQRNIAAPTEVATSTNGQIIADWLKRQGATGVNGIFLAGSQSTWWVSYSAFANGVGALGGGNVSVNAGGDLANLLVAVATNARVGGGTVAAPAKVLELRNGGALDVDVGGAIRGGQLYVGRGEGSIAAGEFTVGRSVTITDTALASNAATYTLAPVLALGDATMSVTTAGDLRLQTVLDPLMAGDRSMSGYTERTALDLTSVGGNITLVNQGKYLSKALTVSVLDSCCTSADQIYQYYTTIGSNLYPSNTRIAALNGNVQIPTLVSPSTNVMSNRLKLMPSGHPELQILAGDSILLNGSILMAHATAAMLPSPFLPVLGGTQNFDFAANLLADGTTTGINDAEPSRIYARKGSIIAAPQIVTSEQIWFRAGTDIRSGSLALRNINGTDVSMLEAGNDIIPNAISIQGPGALLLSAGRDVYGSAPSIQSTGLAVNQVVPGQSTEGASISILAGLKGKQPDYDAFVATYLDPANVAAMPDYLKVNYQGTVLPIYLLSEVEFRKNGVVHRLHEGVGRFVFRVTGQKLSPLEAWATFKTLPALTQQRFLREIYLDELRDAGNNQNTPDANGQPINGGYNRGYAAIATLFPGADWSGDAKFGNVLLRTNLGGDIDILTPGGSFQAASITATVPSGYGVITLGNGNIGIFARNNVVVNQSRILTFAGGDEIIWSTLGDIDAGRGAKTARSSTAPLVTTDVDANTKITERADISGSGIGTVIGYAGVAEGDVDLIAPKGTVNAGDAGIRVSGNFNVAALFVLNVDNIKVGGETKGLPKQSVSIAPLAMETKDKAAADVAKDAAGPSAARAPDSIIIVEILGYGGSSEGETRQQREEQPKRGDKQGLYNVNSPFQVLGNGTLSEEKKTYLTGDERNGLE